MCGKHSIAARRQTLEKRERCPFSHTMHAQRFVYVMNKEHSMAASALTLNQGCSSCAYASRTLNRLPVTVALCTRSGPLLRTLFWWSTLANSILVAGFRNTHSSDRTQSVHVTVFRLEPLPSCLASFLAFHFLRNPKPSILGRLAYSSIVVSP